MALYGHYKEKENLFKSGNCWGRMINDSCIFSKWDYFFLTIHLKQFLWRICCKINWHTRDPESIDCWFFLYYTICLCILFYAIITYTGYLTLFIMYVSKHKLFSWYLLEKKRAVSATTLWNCTCESRGIYWWIGSSLSFVIRLRHMVSKSNE